MIRLLLAKRSRKRISWMLLTVMTVQMLSPNISLALSSGPVQPEVQGFEPVGTTDMVDLFTGDFVYNIPLMDVEGYPLNISYHGGVTMDQEASWVGLGWNITPGTINKGIRGLPDEFNGDTIEKEMNIRPEVTKKLGLAAGLEVFGLGDPLINIGGTLGGYLNMSNYRGVSVDFTASAGINTKLFIISSGLNVGASVGSQTGGSINYDASVGLGISQSVNKDLNTGGSFNLNTGGVYSPRTGLRRSWGFNAGLSLGQNGTRNRATMSTGTTVPIGLQNYTAAITNASYMNTSAGQLKLGGAIYGLYPNGKISGSVTRVEYEPNGSRKGFGYFNLEHSSEQDLLDFSREKDGMFNTTMQYLPQSHLTYDVYSVSGQGTGGSFRPFRNDIGSVFDPKMESNGSSETVNAEGGIGNLFEVGVEVMRADTKTESGPWDNFMRSFNKRGNDYSESIYFKEAGELTENNESYLNAVANSNAITPEAAAGMPVTKVNGNERVVRVNHIYTVSGSDEDTAALLSGRTIQSYSDTTGFKNYPTVNKENIARVGGGAKLKRQPYHVNEIVQTQKDGRRYVYGIPVLNNVQREATFAVDPLAGNVLEDSNYLITYTPGVEDSRSNNRGMDNFYSSTVTPTYVTAHLLTGVLSADYVDVTGNGISDDDLGTYTKFNYSRKSKDYRWRSPIESGKAQYNAGYRTDKRDDKASYMIGSREQWMLHSVETKNYVAEFYVSKRLDAKGVMDRILIPGSTSTYRESPYDTAGNANENRSYKLDSIVLFNKHDRFINKANAQPIKSVFFTYDYTLCKKLPNADADTGKLTLKKIQIRYGRSHLNMTAAYKFKYSDLNPDYNAAAKDRWGNYKPNNIYFNNLDFPFTTQSSATNNYVSAWSLTEIGLPSGGVIKVDYESDDYAYVQNLPAMEMFKVDGFGGSAQFSTNNQLYFEPGTPNLYLYFTRRAEAENGQLSMKDNYLNGTNLLYYNVPVELAGGRYEPIKGYAEVLNVGACSDGIHGYIQLKANKLHNSTYNVNPIVYAALNTARYSLPHIFFPGSNPESSDIDNVVAGMKQAIKELFSMHQNPLKSLIQAKKARNTATDKAFVRLSSPGMMKKGGGQRVKTLKFYDNWAAMAGGQEAIYGKEYRYTMKRDDGKGIISSGVASYEPLIGGDELPQRVPVGFAVQEHTNFPPNDPVELYQEMPLGESFYPGAVVGYSNVSVRSINFDAGRSSQSEDIHGFYTAKDFPVRVHATAIQLNDPKPSITRKDITIDQQATQGFAITLNDMHGKQRNTEHWVFHPGDPVRGREMTSMQKYEYLTSGGALSSSVPAFGHNAAMGQLGSTTRKMGIETDLTIDSRIKSEVTTVRQLSGNLNGFLIAFAPVAIPLGYPFEYSSIFKFRCATATKITQQYGILNKVISSNEGAVTEVRNEIFDAYTGNALVTSVNNEFNDRVFTVNYPAYWAYKEMGPCYENHDLRGKFGNSMLIDSMNAGYASRFVNYNPAFSYGYSLPSNMPVARIAVDEEMPKFKIGDEMLLYHSNLPQPIRTWTMGYTSDVNHCYLILAPREPYRTGSFWDYKKTYSEVRYRVLRSGNRNRLGETIQSYTTTDSANIFPHLNNDLTNVINLNATTYKHHLGQVYAANQVSDSLNPFVTGKVGIYRPDQQIINLKKRSYTGGTTRNAGVFSTPAYWQTELLRGGYCPDSIIGPACGTCDGPRNGGTQLDLDSMRVTYLGGDSVGIRFFRTATNCVYDTFRTADTTILLHTGLPGGITMINDSIVVRKVYMSTPKLMIFKNDCCCASFWITYDDTSLTIQRQNYRLPGGGPALFGNMYRSAGLVSLGGTPIATPYRIRNRILMGKVGHYEGTSLENWVKTQEVTKYNPLGQEIENKEEGIGYNTAVYGYSHTLPICVARNARHSEVLFEGFEDYQQLRPVASAYMSYMPLYYSPFASYFKNGSALGSLYTVANVNATPVTVLSSEDAHTGKYSLKTGATFTVRLDPSGEGIADGYSYKMTGGRKYVVSLWLKPTSISPSVVTTNYTPANLSVVMDTLVSASGDTRTIALQPVSPIIEGWQKFEATFDAPQAYKRFQLNLPSSYYFDDIRAFPFASNSKGFVYTQADRKLAATLDENNYATFYEYDQEGNLVRTKKETEKGILTITESRSTHRKTN